MKLLKVLCVAAIAVAIATSSYAAVQNIKVSGSIDENMIHQNNFDLRNTTIESTNTRNPGVVSANGSGNSINEDGATGVLSTIHVGIDSDLTDNVAASIVLSNQSWWGSDTTAGNVANVSVNKAYVTLKEFFYQPLTLKIGRQDLNFGTGFIVGPGIFRDPSGVFAAPRADFIDDRYVIGNNATAISGPNAQQYSDATWYDAIRATLDFDPWTIDGVYSIVNETGTADADHDLIGANVAYKFDEYNAKAEGYYWFSKDDSFNSDLGYIDPVDYQRINALVAGNAAGLPAQYADTSVHGVGARRYEENRVHVVGLRGDIEPVESLTLSGEGAYQWGHLNDVIGAWNVSTDGSTMERKRSAWAIDLKGDYLWKDVTYKPNLGLGYVFLSGNKSDNNGKFEGWDPMFKGKFYSLIRDYQHGTGTSLNNIGGNIYQTLDYRAPSGSTNNHTLFVDGGLKPMDDLTIKGRYLHFWAAERATNVDGTTRSGKGIGQEIDGALLYDYTEDVQFDLTGGIFFPGKVFDNNTDSLTKGNDSAVIVTGGVKVVF